MTKITGKVLAKGTFWGASSSYYTRTGKLGIPGAVEPTPSNGLVWYDTTTDVSKVYIDGTGWIPLPLLYFVSATVPGSPEPADVWFDTFNNIMYVRTPTAWVPIPVGSGVTINGGTGPAFRFSSQYETFISGFGLTPIPYTDSWGDHTGYLNSVTNSGHTYGFDPSLSISAMTTSNLFSSQGLSQGPDAIYTEYVIDDIYSPLVTTILQVGMESVNKESIGGPGYVPSPFWQAYYNSDGSMLVMRNNAVVISHPAGYLPTYTVGDAIGMVIQRDGLGNSAIIWFLNGVQVANSDPMDINMWFARARVNLGYSVVGYGRGPKSSAPSNLLTLSGTGVNDTYAEYTIDRSGPNGTSTVDWAITVDAYDAYFGTGYVNTAGTTYTNLIDPEFWDTENSGTVGTSLSPTLGGEYANITDSLYSIWDGTKYTNSFGDAILFSLNSVATITTFEIDCTTHNTGTPTVYFYLDDGTLDATLEWTEPTVIPIYGTSNPRKKYRWEFTSKNVSAFVLGGWGGYPQGAPADIFGFVMNDTGAGLPAPTYATSGSLTFAPGVITQSMDIIYVGGNPPAGSNVELTLQNPTNATIVAPAALLVNVNQAV